MKARIWMTVTALFVAGCAPTLQQVPVSRPAAQAEAEKQREIALELQVRRQERLDRVAWRIERNSAELCSRTRKVYGVALHNIAMYSKDFQEAASSLGACKEVTVQSVIEGFPAQEAGLAPGDTLLAINGKPATNLSVTQVTEALRVAAASSESLRVEIGRHDGRRTFSLWPDVICDFPAQVAPDDVVNAYADGTREVIASGMMRFAESDEELALVVGHEIAHNALGHISKKKANAFLGAIVDIAVSAGTGVSTGGLFSNAAAQVFSQEFESEADYEGLYLAARAGFDVSEAPQFWRRMAAEHPSNIKQNFSASHPSTPERFIRLEKEVEEIKMKESEGRPLTPEKANQAGVNEK